MMYAQLQFGANFYSIDIPNGWDQLTPEQFEAVNYIKCTSTDKRLMVFEVLMALLPLTRAHLSGLVLHLLQIKQWRAAFNMALLYVFFDKRKLWQFFATDDVIDALPAIDWLFDNKQNKFTSAIPKLKHKGINYNGPRTLLSGVTWQQMKLADTIIQRFVDTKNEALLNDLAAVLYVQEGYQLNVEDESVPERIKLFTNLRAPLKYAIYTNYVLLRDAFYQQFELPTAEIALEGRPDWEAVTLSVAENGSLGPYQDVEKTPARTVLKYFEKKHKETKNK